MAPIRINKYLASLGITSRRKVDDLIDQKAITINNEIAKKGDRIDPDKDQIKINNKPITQLKEKLIYIILNKPQNILSSVTDNRHRKTVIDLVRIKERLYPVGRLDYNSTGLIILTNDGDLAYRITHPKYHLPKTYKVTVKQHPGQPQLDLLRTGVSLEDGITAPADVSLFHTSRHNNILKITLYQGKNRQIRRMCAAVGLNLLKLHRIKIGPIEIGDLKEGEWRYLDSREVSKLKKYSD